MFIELYSFLRFVLTIVPLCGQNAQNADLMDLELADYERTVLDLNHQLEDRDNCIASLRAEVGHNEQHFSLLRSQIGELGLRCHPVLPLPCLHRLRSCMHRVMSVFLLAILSALTLTVTPTECIYICICNSRFVERF